VDVNLIRVEELAPLDMSGRGAPPSG
jgi:hypothetical protein